MFNKFCDIIISMMEIAGIQGFKINLLKYNDALGFVKTSLDNGENIQIVTINPEMIETARKHRH